jgi:hypothetical protein
MPLIRGRERKGGRTENKNGYEYYVGCALNILKKYIKI